MKIEIDRFSKEEWANWSEASHKICFGTVKPREWDRFDFTLFAHNGERPLGYVSCREYDPETLYWQFGGAYPDTKGTPTTWLVYAALTNWCRGKYKRITTLIENTNDVMIRMALKMGYRIVGLRSYGGSILLEHVLELEEGV